MNNEYDTIKQALKELEYLKEAKKYVLTLKDKKIKDENEFIGKKFNMLKVLEKTDRREKNGSILYKCQCECGNIVYYSSHDLKRNTSCGCWRKSQGRTDKMKKSMKSFENTMIKLLENRKINSNNKSGYTGVRYNKYKKKWEAYITLRYKQIALGTFDTKEEAIQARLDGEKKYFKPIIERYKKSENNF